MSNLVTVKIPLRSQFLVRVSNLRYLNNLSSIWHPFHSTFDTLFVIWDTFQHLRPFSFNTWDLIGYLRPFSTFYTLLATRSPIIISFSLGVFGEIPNVFVVGGSLRLPNNRACFNSPAWLNTGNYNYTFSFRLRGIKWVRSFAQVGLLNTMSRTFT